jgi:hypothetical protein
VKVDFSCAPTETTTILSPTAIPAAIKPYSSEVPPASSFPNRLVSLSTEASRRQWPRPRREGWSWNPLQWSQSAPMQYVQIVLATPGSSLGFISSSLTSRGVIEVNLRQNWRTIRVPKRLGGASRIQSQINRIRRALQPPHRAGGQDFFCGCCRLWPTSNVFRAATAICRLARTPLPNVLDGLAQAFGVYVLHLLPSLPGLA